MFRKDNKKVILQNSESQTYTGTRELLDSEMSLLGYSNGIVNKFFKKMNLQERIIEKKGSILEFGAGTGFLAEIFRSKFSIVPHCIELDLDLAKILRNKNFTCWQFLREAPTGYSTIYTSNVLEHIEDDNKILREIYHSLEKGGILGIYVPAFPILYSEMDFKVGHVRRYTKNDLKEKVQNSGFRVESISYNDSLGFFATIFVKVLGYRSKRVNLGSKRSLIFYDRFGYPVSRTLDQLGLKFLFGKNLFLIAIKE
jgi:SAM-dependent methyltransferase